MLITVDTITSVWEKFDAVGTLGFFGSELETSNICDSNL